MTDSTDRILFQRIAGNDTEAFRTLYESYERRVYAAAYKLTGSREATEDLLQEVFLNIWHYRKNLSDVDKPFSYIFRILSNTFQNYIRNDRNRELLLDLRPLENDLPDNQTEEDILGRELTGQLGQAIDQLSPQRQRVFNLRHRQGYSWEEIGQQLQISPQTARNTYMDAVRIVRNHLKDLSPFLLILLTRRW